MKNMNVTQWCHHFLEMQVLPGDLCIDATAGKGNDTKKLAELAGPDGRDLAFDIQTDALNATEKLLEKQELISRVQLIHAGHEHMAEYAQSETVNCIIFNLGYLPGGDHNISTRAATTLTAIQSGLKLLKRQGLMTLCIYQGGDTGFEEHDSVLEYLKSLDSRKYLVILSSYYNRPNTPPDLALVIKL